MKSRKFTLILATVLLLMATVLFTACDAKTKLTAPQDISYDGTVLTWPAVENADSYTVKINDAEPLTVRTNSYAYRADGTTFTVEIKAQNTTGKKPVLSDAFIMEFKPLEAINEVRVANDGSISWDMANLATGYKLKLDGKELEQVVYVPEFKEIGAGAHSIQVRPVIDGDPSYYSSWSPAVSLTILETLTKDDITYADGKLSWTYVTGAQYYEIKVNGVVLSSECTSTQIEYDPHHADFEATVKAIGNHASTYDGSESEIKKFVFLDPVTNIRVEDGILLWDAVNGADAYRLKLNNTVYSQTFTECSFDKLTANVPTDIQIMPITSDTAYFSDWSTVKSVLLLSAPHIRWEGDFNLSGEAIQSIVWDGIDNVAGYAVELTRPDGTVVVNSLGSLARGFEEAYLQKGTYKVRVKALAAADSTNVTCDSAYSTPITVVRLEGPKPTGDEYIKSNPEKLSEGFVVNCKAVTGASQYRLFKNGAEEQSNITPQFTVTELVSEMTLEEQQFNFRVQAVGSVKTVDGMTVVSLNSLEADDLSFNITVLATPAKRADGYMSGYNFSFGSVNGAMGYAVDVGGMRYTASATTYDLSILEAGSYNVRVCAKGNGTNVLASNYSSPLNVVRLAAPTNVRIQTENAEGLLSYNSVLHATGYTVVFNNDGNAVPADSISNINSRITEAGTTLYMQSTANYYNEDQTVYYMTSSPSATYTFIKLAAPVFADPIYDNGRLVWNKPSNINTEVYTPTYNVYPDETNRPYNGEFNGTSIDLSGLEGGQTYVFTVEAIGDGTRYVNSNRSDPRSLYKLVTPTVTRENGKYVWSSVARAVSYAVYVDGELMETYSAQSGAKSFSYSPNFSELKTYTVQVIAVGDGITSIDSNPATIYQETKQLITPDFTVSYSQEAYSSTGEIVVTITTKSPYATGYSYTVAGVTKTSPAETHRHNPGSAGTFDVRVYALGGSFDENGIYYLDSQSQGGNARYQITLLASINIGSNFKLTADDFLSWDPVAGSSGYEISYSIDGAGFTAPEKVMGTSYGFADLSNVTILTVRIRAKGNGVNSVSSEYVEKTWTLK